MNLLKCFLLSLVICLMAGYTYAGSPVEKPNPSNIATVLNNYKQLKEDYNNKLITKKEYRKEKKNLRKSFIKELKNLKKSKGEPSQVLLIILAILLPPLAVGLKFGIVDKFWISLILTLLFWIPGVVYALVVILK